MGSKGEKGGDQPDEAGRANHRTPPNALEEKEKPFPPSGRERE